MPDLKDFQTVVLAGGGNRCWWQAGLLSVWLNEGRIQPTALVGVSAGAALAAALLSQTLDEAKRACSALYNAHQSVWLGQPKARFAHELIYPQWVANFMTDAAVHRLHRGPTLLSVGVARLPRWLPNTLGMGLAMVAYLADKYATWPSHAPKPHPSLPRWLGIHMDLIETTHANTAQAAAPADFVRNLLVCSAAAVPFIRARPLLGHLAIDGGFADNAPRPAMKPTEHQLVLLTRHDPKARPCFQFQGRWYLQPSERVPVSTWDCTAKTNIQHAIALGERDAVHSLRAINSGQSLLINGP
jgi:predicted acylesterase/phospholipase RssA